MAISINAIAFLGSDPGLTTASIVQVQRHNSQVTELWQSVSTLRAALAVAGGVVMVIFGSHEPVVRVLLAVYALQNLVSAYSADWVLSGLIRIGSFGVLPVIQAATGVILWFLLSARGRIIAVEIPAMGVVCAAAGTLAGIRFARLTPRLNLRTAMLDRERFRSWWPVFSCSLALIATQNIDILTINHYHGYAASGVYALVYRWYIFCITAILGFGRPLLGLLSKRLPGAQASSRVHWIGIAAVAQTVGLMLGMVIGPRLGNPQLAGVLTWLVPAGVLLALHTAVLQVGFLSAGVLGRMAGGLAIESISHLLFALLLVPRWGLPGAALSNWLSNTVLSVVLVGLIPVRGRGAAVADCPAACMKGAHPC